ncbi:MAG: hypothetical protein ACPGJV_09665 [Bacteriovoracaceae bacterium]
MCEWVNFSNTLAPAFRDTKLEEDNNFGYGAHWWLNVDIPKKKEVRPFPMLSEKVLLGLGHHGQMLIVLPTLNAVIVRNGSDKIEKIDRNIFFSLFLKGVRQ